MGPTNIVAHELESHGVRTFSAKEMAFNILGLMHPLLFSITQVEPIWADLNGGMDRLPNLADITTRIRSKLNKKADLRRAIARDNSADFKIINGVTVERLFQTVNVLLQANFRFEFPSLKATSSLQDLAHLQGLIDLNQIVIITGLPRLAHGEAHVRDGKWKLEESLQLKAALRWHGSWDLSSISTADSKMDRCMLDGLTVKLMNLLTTKRLKVVMKRISCFMLVSILLLVSATRPFISLI